jgi:hypothetical protein
MFSLNSYLLYGSEEKLISAEVKIRLQFPVLKKRLLLVFNLIILEKQRKKNQVLTTHKIRLWRLI